MTKMLLVLLTSILASSTIAAGFDQRPNPNKPPPEQSKADEPEQDAPTLPEDMRLRMKREREELEHRKIVDSARQLFDTSVELAKGYKDAKKKDEQGGPKPAENKKSDTKKSDASGGTPPASCPTPSSCSSNGPSCASPE